MAFLGMRKTWLYVSPPAPYKNCDTMICPTLHTAGNQYIQSPPVPIRPFYYILHIIPLKKFRVHVLTKICKTSAPPSSKQTGKPAEYSHKAGIITKQARH